MTGGRRTQAAALPHSAHGFIGPTQQAEAKPLAGYPLTAARGLHPMELDLARRACGLILG